MKKIVLATAFTMASTSAFAGGLSQPAMEKEVMMEKEAMMEEVMVKENKVSLGSILLPIAFAAAVAIVAFSD
jgi:hypothetical protein